MRELHSSIKLYAHGVTLLVARDWDSKRPRFQITGPRYHCVIPVCGCDRIACVGTGRWRGRCALAENKGKDGTDHNRDHCHATVGAMHAEHVMVLAETVLKTYDPKAKPSALTIGVPHGRLPGQYLLPLEGQEYVRHSHNYFGDSDFFRVFCNAVRCRDERGHVKALPAVYPTQDQAKEAVARHKDWHAEVRESKS